MGNDIAKQRCKVTYVLMSGKPRAVTRGWPQAQTKAWPIIPSQNPPRGQTESDLSTTLRSS
ncbi:hypothetical protein [Vulcanisaeta souniana]|uniref:hypothetical protein n=1 Tax=Vulcanisaeta souniana TaxID=164452 RepID=UPI000A6D6CED|nr:hypothetical protein [Vulcanisaeta souniana]